MMYLWFLRVSGLVYCQYGKTSEDFVPHLLPGVPSDELDALSELLLNAGELCDPIPK